MLNWVNWVEWVIIVIISVIAILGFLFKYISLYISNQLAADKKRREAQKPIKKPQDENLINVKWKYVKEKKKKENKICQKKIC